MKKIVSVVMLIILSVSILSGCDNTGMREIKKSDEGYRYFLSKQIGGICIVEMPVSRYEELIIPEYIDGYRVVQLGYLYHGLALATNYELKLNDLKRLTLHSLVYPYSVDFGNLETIVYIDILYCTLFTNVRTYNFNSPYPENINIELKKSNRELDLTKNKIECFYIDKNVKVIQTGVFDGVEGVIIRTSYESKPEGWEDGWNGNCQVEWGVNLD